MRFGPLTTNERAENDATHWLELTADDLTVTATNTTQLITLPHVFAVGDIVKRITFVLTTPFKDASDAAFNVTTISIGDSVGSATSIMAAKELNVNGTEILNFSALATGTPATGFTAATTLTATFTSMAAKALNDIDVGVIKFEFEFFRPTQIANAINAGPRLTKG